MSKYPIHRDFEKYEKTNVPLAPILLPLVNGMVAAGFKKRKLENGVREIKKKIPGYQNGTIDIIIYEQKETKAPLPCLIYLHGGAFVIKGSEVHKHLMCEYVAKTPCKVVYVDYRLAPKYAFPVGVEDSYAAFMWTCENAAEIGIDPEKIAIGGDSAGGALSAAVCQMARDRKAPKICFQMLVYPVIDARQTTQSIKEFVDTPLWNSRQNQKMWKLYLKNGDHSNRAYASPIEAKTLKNLPAAYIEVAEYDCLRDEGIAYAMALEKSGVTVELNQPKQTIHGFEMAEDNEIVKQSIIKRVNALKNAFL